MEWLRWQRNPWGQEILRGLSWDTAWLAVAVGLLFVGMHTVLYYWRWRKCFFADRGPDKEVAHLPERVVRHSLASRLFHWVMAASMVVGWIPRDRYLDHYDPERWPVAQQPAQQGTYRADAANGEKG